ncbi:MAG TPA: hypothetical protein DIU00_23845 [Phycisphaerales bacterium]|nr:hypothetical protein [Phycisphaerales bacterium]
MVKARLAIVMPMPAFPRFGVDFVNRNFPYNILYHSSATLLGNEITSHPFHRCLSAMLRLTERQGIKNHVLDQIFEKAALKE